jgi:hypothetical protein
MDSTRRAILTAGVAAAAAATVPRLFAQQTGNGKFYERGPVRIYYEETGSGFPLLLLPGGGLNATIRFFTGNPPFNAIEEFKSDYRCITAESQCRCGAGAARRVASGDARPEIPRRVLGELGRNTDPQAARDLVADDRSIRHQDVRDRP